ncbi:protein mono-ADP-ribosyltransferase Parp16, partial [Musca vetustissima]|uniref:protein mono-ADP-ribosyltransferase Parp16 n=1 Tax=Musca vetustissima TaxID=27455 RepID=UPI002AB7DE91
MQAAKIIRIREHSKNNQNESNSDNVVISQDVEQPPSSAMQESYDEPTTSQHKIEPIDFLNKAQALRNSLQKDLMGCDAKWTLFVATAFSYRNRYKLKPFPPRFGHASDHQNIDALISVINDTPKLNIVLHNLIGRYFDNVDPEVIELLYWILIEQMEPRLRLVNFEEIKDTLQNVDMPQKPTQIFEVMASEGFHADVDFQKKISNSPTKLGFYGSTLDSYYSIIYNGFSDVTDTGAINISLNLESCLQQNPCGAAWGASQCGSLISCVAVCEFAGGKSTSTGEDHQSYLEVDPHAIRMRYLLFYGSRYPLDNKPEPLGWKAWFLHHKRGILFSTYMLVITTIAVVNSGDRGEYIKKLITKKFQNFLEF